MKNLIKILALLIIIQTALSTPTLGQDTTINIPVLNAKEIIKDLKVGDFNKLLVIKKDDIISKKDSIIVLKDTIINFKSTQIQNYKEIVVYKDNMIFEKDRIINKLDRKLKFSKFKTTISQLALLVLGVFTITKL